MFSSGFNAAGFVSSFRHSSPYIHAHRGKTVVVVFGGEVIADASFSGLVNDLALLNSLGIRLVLVHGIRPQIEARMALRGIPQRYYKNLRVTDADALECVKEAAGTVRVEIEAMLSLSLINTPMAGVRVRVSSGNVVMARPLGVIDGIDYQYTGSVRKIDDAAICEKLDCGDMVLLSPLGYSSTGEIFNLRAEDVAKQTAIALNADKLLLLSDQVYKKQGSGAIRELTVMEAERLLLKQEMLPEGVVNHLKLAVEAIEAGVKRVHLLNRSVDGAILLELFTRDGQGMLISASPFEEMRAAHIDDLQGMLELIRPLEETGILLKRSQKDLEYDIGNFSVIERDGSIIGCAALHLFPEDNMAELACLAIHPDYRSETQGERLLRYLELKASVLGIGILFVLTTQALHWFREMGFSLAAVDVLPRQKQSTYDYRRNSAILIKALSQ
ncbi:amino-acid N-acetyltransferase [Candidatus Methylospira mobilis]|uniref:Amino-acid acetyltransferase n=1 Tax=Candidatus Methylospira mobilis TaxID=1808979 RepID=A0A5Q0BL59_9GAMM|nr:amino-acid N-acetyltransferase [Candidatus Methylospira mobilis]QFY42858.1 amino-acid N-acetyltransferase [Candidatus Methylospira mobilis]